MSRAQIALYVAAHKVVADPSSSEEDRAKANATLDFVRTPQIGTKFLVRTPTVYSAGTLVYIDDKWLVLMDAEAVASVGETEAAGRTGKWSVSERYHDGVVRIPFAAVIDMTTVGA